MNETYYKIMEDRFGPAFPESKEYEYWMIENVGWTDPKRPSWFDCGKRFNNAKDARAYAKDWSRKNGIQCRITKIVSKEEYEYVKVKFDRDDLKEIKHDLGYSRIGH